MLTTALLMNLLSRLLAWVRRNLWLTVCIALALVLLLVWMSGDETKPVKVDVPYEEINAVQKERDGDIANTFNAIDNQRAKDDAKIANSKKKPIRTGNVTANQLEEMLNANR